MKTAAIIHEFVINDENQARRIAGFRRDAGADYLVAVMSGNYLQCGLPAAESKHVRAKKALEMGVDAVVEIPVFTALTGLDTYTPSAIALLDKLHCVDVIGVPIAVQDRELVEKITFFLFAEGKEFQNEVKKYRGPGVSFYDAQAKAVGRRFAGAEEMMRDPVNYTAFECLKSLKRMYSSMKPHLLPGDFWQPGPSACDSDTQASSGERPDRGADMTVAGQNTQASSAEQVRRQSEEKAQQFFPLIKYQALLIREKMDQIYGGSSVFSRRILDHIERCSGYRELAKICAGADRTPEDINRFLFHVLLGIGKPDIAMSRMYDSAPYVRVLAWKETAQPFVELAKKKSRIPVITDVKESYRRMDAARRELFDIDIRAAKIYKMF